MRLPDTCNTGTWLRVLLAVNAGSFLLALARSPTLNQVPVIWFEKVPYVEPTTMGSLLLLCASRTFLDSCNNIHRLFAYCAIVALVLLVSLVNYLLVTSLIVGPDMVINILLWSVISAILLIWWFDTRYQIHERGLAQAQLMALSARIRPHFLFNSLNAVLGIIRTDPRRAETTLEELADLFRVLMKDTRDLVLLSDEVLLAQRYLEIEKLRLGDRLQVRWEIGDYPPDTLMPALMLQPLLENAVYYGVEPEAHPGEIIVKIYFTEKRIQIILTNPHRGATQHRKGNKMALENIKQRLALFFDLEATLETQEIGNHTYKAKMTFPYRKQS